jgi:hypothetical protein
MTFPSIRAFWARLVNAVLPGMRRQAIFRYGSVSIAPPIEIAPNLSLSPRARGH